MPDETPRRRRNDGQICTRCGTVVKPYDDSWPGTGIYNPCSGRIELHGLADLSTYVHNGEESSRNKWGPPVELDDDGKYRLVQPGALKDGGGTFDDDAVFEWHETNGGRGVPVLCSKCHNILVAMIGEFFDHHWAYIPEEERVLEATGA